MSTRQIALDDIQGGGTMADMPVVPTMLAPEAARLETYLACRLMTEEIQ